MNELIKMEEKVNSLLKTAEEINKAEELYYADKKFIYLMYSDTLNLYKIGFTRNVKNRASSIKAAFSSAGVKTNVNVIFYFCACGKDAKEIESALHSNFKEERKFGEWFDLSSEDLENFSETAQIVSCQIEGKNNSFSYHETVGNKLFGYDDSDILINKPMVDIILNKIKYIERVLKERDSRLQRNDWKHA